MRNRNDRKKSEKRALSDVAKAQRPSYDIATFLQFINQAERGRQREANQALESFVKQAERWSADRRRDFAAWLMGIVEGLPDASEVLVTTLRARFLQPVLIGWRAAVPEDIRPYRWLGLYIETPDQLDNLRAAIRLGGQQEQRAILKIAHKALYAFWYNQHHFPLEYMGEPEKDIILAQEVNALIALVKDKRVREGLARDMEVCIANMQDWSAFIASGDADFDQWRQRRDALLPPAEPQPEPVMQAEQ